MKNSFQYIYHKIKVNFSLIDLVALHNFLDHWIKRHSVFLSLVTILYKMEYLYYVFLNKALGVVGWRVISGMKNFKIIFVIIYCVLVILSKSFEFIFEYGRGTLKSVIYNKILYDFFIFILTILDKIFDFVCYLISRLIFKLRNFITISLIIFYWADIKKFWKSLKPYFPNNRQLAWKRRYRRVYKYTRDYFYGSVPRSRFKNDDLPEWKSKIFNDVKQVFWQRPLYKGLELFSENIAKPVRYLRNSYLGEICHVWNLPIFRYPFFTNKGYMKNTYGNWLNYSSYLNRFQFMSENEKYFETHQDFDFKIEPYLMYNHGVRRFVFRYGEHLQLFPFFDIQARKLFYGTPLHSDLQLFQFLAMDALDPDLQELSMSNPMDNVDNKDGPDEKFFTYIEDLKIAMKEASLYNSNDQMFFKNKSVHSIFPTGIDLLKDHWPRPADFFHVRAKYLTNQLSLQQLSRLKSGTPLLEKLSLWENRILYTIMEVFPADILFVKWKYDFLNLIVSNPYYLSNKLEYFFQEIDLNSMFMINNLAISFIVYEISDIFLARIIIYPKLMLSVLVNLVFDKFWGELFGHLVLGDRLNYIMPVTGEARNWEDEYFDELEYRSLFGVRTITNHYNIGFKHAWIPFELDQEEAFGKYVYTCNNLLDSHDFLVLAKPSYPQLAFFSPSSVANFMFDVIWEHNFDKRSQYGEDFFDTQLRNGSVLLEITEDYRYHFIGPFTGIIFYFVEVSSFFWFIFITSGFLKMFVFSYIFIKAFINCMNEVDKRLYAFRKICEMAGIVYKPWDGTEEKFYDFFEDVFKNEVLDNIPNTMDFEGYFKWWEIKNRLIIQNNMKGFFKRTTFFEDGAYTIVMEFIISFPFLYLFHILKVTIKVFFKALVFFLTILLCFVIFILNIVIDLLIYVIKTTVMYWILFTGIFTSENRFFRLIRLLWFICCIFVYYLLIFFYKFFFVIYWFVFNFSLLHFINFVLEANELRFIETRFMYPIMMFFFFDVLWLLCVLFPSFKTQLFCSDKNPDIISSSAIDWETWSLVTDLDPFDHNEKFHSQSELISDDADELYEHLLNIYEEEDDEDDDEDEEEEEEEFLEEREQDGQPTFDEDGDDEDFTESSPEVGLVPYQDKDIFDWANYNNMDDTEKRLLIQKFFKEYVVNSYYLDRGYKMEDRWVVELMLNRFYNPVITQSSGYNSDMRQLPLGRVDTNLNEYTSFIDYDPSINLCAMYGQPDDVKKHFREMLKTGRLKSYPYLLLNAPFGNYEWNENLNILFEKGKLRAAVYKVKKRKSVLEEIKEEERRKKMREKLREQMRKKGYKGAFPFEKELDKEIIIKPSEIEARKEDVEHYEELYSYRIEFDTVKNNNVFIVNHYDFAPSNNLSFDHYTLDITQAFDNNYKYEFFCDLNFYKMYLGLEHLPRMTKEELERVCAFIGCTSDQWHKIDPDFKKSLFKVEASLPFYNFSFPLFCSMMLTSFVLGGIYKMYTLPIKPTGTGSGDYRRLNILDYYLIKDFFYEITDFFKSCWLFYRSGMWREYYESVLNIYDSPEHYYRRYLMEHAIMLYEAYDNKYKLHFYTEMPLLNRFSFKGFLQNVPPYLTEDELYVLLWHYKISKDDWDAIDKAFIKQVDRVKNNEHLITLRMTGRDEFYNMTIGLHKEFTEAWASRTDEVRRISEANYYYYTKNYESYSDALFRLFYLRLYDNKGRIVPFNDETRLKYDNILEKGYFSQSGFNSLPNYLSFLNLKFSNFTNLARMRLIEKFSHHTYKYDIFRLYKDHSPDYLTMLKKLQFMFGKGRRWVIDIPFETYAKWREEELDEFRDLGYFDVFHPISFRAVRLLHLFDRLKDLASNPTTLWPVKSQIHDFDVWLFENQLLKTLSFFKESKPLKLYTLVLDYYFSLWPLKFVSGFRRLINKFRPLRFYLTDNIGINVMNKQLYEQRHSLFNYDRMRKSKLLRTKLYRSTWYANDEEIITNRLSAGQLFPLNNGYDDFYFSPFRSYNKLYNFYINYSRDVTKGNARSFLNDYERYEFYRHLVPTNLGFKSRSAEQKFDALEIWDFNIQNLGLFDINNYTPSFYLPLKKSHSIEMIVPELFDVDELYWFNLDSLFSGVDRGNNPENFITILGTPEAKILEYRKGLKIIPGLNEDTPETEEKINIIIEKQLNPLLYPDKKLEELIPETHPRLEVAAYLEKLDDLEDDLIYKQNYFDLIVDLERYIHYNTSFAGGVFNPNPFFANEILEKKQLFRYTSMSHDFLPLFDYIRQCKEERSFVEKGSEGDFFRKFRNQTIYNFGTLIDFDRFPGWLERLGINNMHGFLDFLSQHYLRPAGHVVNPHGGLEHTFFYVFLKYIKSISVFYDLHIKVYIEAWFLIYRRLKWKEEWNNHFIFRFFHFMSDIYYYIYSFFEEYSNLVYILFLKYKTSIYIYLDYEILRSIDINNWSDVFFIMIVYLFIFFIYITTFVKMFFFKILILPINYIISFIKSLIIIIEFIIQNSLQIVFELINLDFEWLFFNMEFAGPFIIFDPFFIYFHYYMLNVFDILYFMLNKINFIFNLIFKAFFDMYYSIIYVLNYLLLMLQLIGDIYAGKFLISSQLDITCLFLLLRNLDLIFYNFYDIIIELLFLLWFNFINVDIITSDFKVIFILMTYLIQLEHLCGSFKFYFIEFFFATSFGLFCTFTICSIISFILYRVLLKK